MASKGSTLAIIAKRESALALMPPPPLKRIKRPSTVLDEDDYTEGLSAIIARDYYPGLEETSVQEEYLAALDSRNEAWIAEARGRLSGLGSRESASRLSRRPVVNTTAVTGSDSISNPVDHDLSLSDFQAKYTSEDNASFNDLLDKQNDQKRERHAYLWMPNQQLLSKRQLSLIEDGAVSVSDSPRSLVTTSKRTSSGASSTPIMTFGATDSRPASVDSWSKSTAANALFFAPPDREENGLSSIQARKEAISRAGPKQIIFENTRFPMFDPRSTGDEDTGSLHTSVIARRAMRRDDLSDIVTDFDDDGSQTPRVNGYSYIDEEDPIPRTQTAGTSEPSYRDLLAGQTDSSARPFHVREAQKREDLHHRLVERNKEKTKQREKVTRVNTGSSTPAGNRLAESIGMQTRIKQETQIKQEPVDWTPAATPRRAKV